ncbi:MAG: hypothetical protein IJG33_17690 [Selenomonadaceae bacterium]|nr:hypothetical protein [Selenomonadaceae bacterium]
MKEYRKNHVSDIKTEYTEKVAALREFFLEIVDRNFISRCRFVQLFFDPETSDFVRIVNELNPPPSPPLSPNAVRFPLISLNDDFRILQSFFVQKVPNFNLSAIFTQDPISSAYDELIGLDKLEEYRKYQRELYGDIFDSWAQTYRTEIEDMNLPKI